MNKNEPLISKFKMGMNTDADEERPPSISKKQRKQWVSNNLQETPTNDNPEQSILNFEESSGDNLYGYP